MTSERKPYNLSEIEPIAPAPDADDADVMSRTADRVGLTAAATVGSTPAVGVSAAVEDEPADSPSGEESSEPRGR
jgi:hypothetical protein